jgi:hypothetical protein
VAQLLIDIVKVDRSLVPHSAYDPGWRLVSAVTDLGRAFGRKVVVEGIETPYRRASALNSALSCSRAFYTVGHARPRTSSAVVPPHPDHGCCAERNPDRLVGQFVLASVLLLLGLGECRQFAFDLGLLANWEEEAADLATMRVAD